MLYTTLMTYTKLILSWFGAGYFPYIPGTMGSLAALPFIWALTTYGGPWGLTIFAIATFIVGYYGCQKYLRRHRRDSDPSWIVIDEVVGQSIPFLFLPWTWTNVAIAFALFRLFDIWKPWPVSWADRLHGGSPINALAVMLDDVLAGVYTTIVLSILMWVFPGLFLIK
jgi:phosphatidylglycerophosphatase A